MEGLGRSETTFAELISLSDGYIDFGVVRFRSREIAKQRHYPSSFGLSHFGFWLNNVMLRRSGSERLALSG